MGQHTQKLRLTRRGQFVATIAKSLLLAGFIIGLHALVAGILVLVGAA